MSATKSGGISSKATNDEERRPLAEDDAPTELAPTPIARSAGALDSGAVDDAVPRRASGQNSHAGSRSPSVKGDTTSLIADSPVISFNGSTAGIAAAVTGGAALTNYIQQQNAADPSVYLDPNGEMHSVTAPPGMFLFGHQFPTYQVVVGGILFIASLGILLGLIPGMGGTENSALSPALNQLSRIIGWWYFFAWAVSFLPQLYLNYRRKSVVGQSFPYVFMNVLGFSAYSIYNVCFFAVTPIKEQYVAEFGHPNNVQPNDVAFALYSLCCCCINCWQIAFYTRGPQKIPRIVLGGIGIVVVVLVVWAIVLAAGVKTTRFFNWLDWLYGLSVVKLAVSVIKYIPQIYLNFSRKCTVGWNIWNVLLDFTGGMFSVVQEAMDSQYFVEQFLGNPIKFVLGTFSMLYDIIFMIQHYILYRENNKKLHEQEKQRRLMLLSGLRGGTGNGPRSIASAAAIASGNLRRGGEPNVSTNDEEVASDGPRSDSRIYGRREAQV